ncbi:MAG: PAS domain-containing protein [Deltaproteobacteria bacterium]
MSRSFFQRNYCSILITGMTVVILIVDLWIPLGFGIWELYAIPLWLAFRASKSPPRLIGVIAAMGSVFSVAEIPISRPGGILLYAFFNRGLWALILCIAAVVLTTARKNEVAACQSEEQLRVSEERYRLLTQAVPSMIYERYVNGGNFFYTDDWYEYTGLTPQQTVGDGWMQALHPDDIERLGRRSVAERNPAIMHERRMRFRRKDGQYRWMLVRSVPVRGENGEIVRRVGAITDIDDMVHAQNALRENEAQFRAMFEAAVVGQSQASATTGLFTRVNQRFCEMTGYSEAELLQMTSRDLLHPADVLGGSLPILEGNKDEIACEIRFLRKDGNVIWVNASVRLLRDDDNKPMQTIAIYQDITRRKEAEESLQRVIDGLSLAQHIVAAGVWDLDLVSGEDYFSPAYYDLYGLRHGERITFERWLMKHVVVEDRRRVTEAGRRLFESGTDWNTEFRIEHPTRGLRWLASVGRLKRDADGQRLRFTGMDIDITERKRMEAQLQDYVKVLQDADRRKDEFLAMLGHELRNPLSVINTNLQLLDSQDDLREIMTGQVSHMSRLLDDLLDVSRITRGQIRLNMQPCDLTALVRETVEEHRRLFVEGGLSVRSELPDEPLWVIGDSTRLKQVIGNGLQNANKFTDSGGTVRVTLTKGDGESSAVMTIRDTGVGMDAEMLKRAFEPFSQAEGTIKRSRSGLGLGLALVKGVIDLHRGSVSLHSEGPGTGSELTIRLPLTESRPAKPVMPVLEPTFRSCRILLIEDNQMGARTMRMVLTRMGHEVEVAHSGKEGIEAARQFGPEVVLCDIGLPDMDGFAVARTLRRETTTAEAYLIALSGYGQTEYQTQALEAGFKTYLTKPLDLNDLRGILVRATA